MKYFLLRIGIVMFLSISSSPINAAVISGPAKSATLNGGQNLAQTATVVAQTKPQPKPEEDEELGEDDC